MLMYGGQCIYVFDHDNWMLTSFSFALFMDFDIPSVHEKREKKSEANVLSSSDWTSFVNKGFLANDFVLF